MKNVFQDIFRGKTVIVGIGNSLRGDDGFGPALIQRLKGKIKATCIDAGSAPENYTGKIAREKPDTILIVDALHLGLAPGEYRILKKEQILNCGLSTHDISPKMLIEYLEKQTSADIYILGVQPQNVSFGEGLSPSVNSTLRTVSQIVRESVPNAIGKVYPHA